MHESIGRRVYIVVSTVFLIALCLLMLAPLVRVFCESVSGKTYVQSNAILFWPKGFTLEAYRVVMSGYSIMTALKNSVFVTVIGTLLSLVMTTLLAYPLSRPEFLFKKPLLLMVTITMIFTAPMIPTYLVVKALQLDNTLWSVMLPTTISAFNFFIMRSFFSGLPNELVEAARIDGCGEFMILLRIVLPLSKASFATLGLFYGVGYWDALQQPLIYLRDPRVYTLQIQLFNMLSSIDEDAVNAISQIQLATDTVKMATIIVTILPILIVYPFLQKYFVTGATLGSVKE